MPCRGKKLEFGPDAQTEAAHAKEVAHLRANPPQDAFGACLPQNVRPEAGTKLAPDSCHKDSDRVDTDGLPKVGAAVWPGQTYCSMVCHTVPASDCAACCYPQGVHQRSRIAPSTNVIPGILKHSSNEPRCLGRPQQDIR